MATDYEAALGRIAEQAEDRPTTLPGWCYADENILMQERDRVLAPGWRCLGRVDELPHPGDYLTAMILDEPVVAVRGADSNIRVLSNLCRHRGMRLSEGKGNLKRLVCPYHAWSYGLDGGLLRAPHMKNPDISPETCALPRFHSEIWNGFLYVNLADDPAPLGPQLTRLDTLIGAYEPAEYRLVHTAEEVWACNWKCLVENFMEGYHLSVVHPETLRGYTPTELACKSVSADAFTSYLARYPADIPSRGTGAAGLGNEQRHASTLFAIYPTQVVSISAHLLVSLTLHPRSADRVDVRWTMSIHPSDHDDRVVADRVRLWTEVNREDREKLEVLQQGLKSRHAWAGPLAAPDLEGTIRDFHLYLSRMILQS